MPQEGFEPMTSVFERAKAVHALDRVATVIGNHLCMPKYQLVCYIKEGKWAVNIYQYGNES
jgi:hypothetical protein